MRQRSGRLRQWSWCWSVRRYGRVLGATDVDRRCFHNVDARRHWSGLQTWLSKVWFFRQHYCRNGRFIREVDDWDGRSRSLVDTNPRCPHIRRIERWIRWRSMMRMRPQWPGIWSGMHLLQHLLLQLLFETHDRPARLVAHQTRLWQFRTAILPLLAGCRPYIIVSDLQPVLGRRSFRRYFRRHLVGRLIA